MLLAATASDVDTVTVDGEIVVCEGRHVLAGEPSQDRARFKTGLDSGQGSIQDAGSIGRSSSA